MKIKLIELIGFKSFPERTVIHVLPGITAIVGPNGCGKSNIVDAIRWALGEQSLSPLRGKTIDDIIFCGSDSKKPLGMAEVSVVFINDGSAPPPYANYSEIEICRRVYRSGESEYFINRIPCRLKDITELFMDTGAGAKAYAIIEQGRIGSILNARPDELRNFIDEVAGISKYRLRKKAALKRMEATSSNLQRVKDILGEIKRQLNSLERQAKRAERYRRLRDELRELDLMISSTLYRRMKNQYEELRKILLPLKEKQGMILLKISEDEARVEERRLTSIELEKEIMEIQKLLNKTKERISALDRNMLIAIEKINNLRGQHIRLKEEAGFIQLQLKELSDEVTSLKSKKMELKQKYEEELSQFISDEGVLEGIRSRHQVIVEEIERNKDRLIQLLVEITGIGNSIQSIEKKKEMLAVEREKRKAEYLRESRNRMELENREAEIKRTIEELDSDISSKQIEQEERRRKLEILRKKFDDIYSNLRGFQEKRERLEARLGALREIQKNYEGLKGGIKDVMMAKGENLNGIRELVADIFDADPRYLRCIESVLGERVQSIIVNGFEDCISALRYIKERGKGRLTFIPLSLRSDANEVELSYEEGLKGPLINFVKVKEEYEDLGRKLLEGVLLVESFDVAYKLWKKREGDFTFVTDDGDVIYPSGIVTGGYGEEGVMEYIRRRGEIRELEKMIEMVKREEEKEAENLEALKGELESIEIQLNEASNSLEKIQKLLNENRRDLENYTQRIANLNLKLQVLEKEINYIEKEQSTLIDEMGKLEDERSRLEEEKAVVESLINRLQEEEKMTRTKIEETEKGISEFRARAFSLNEIIEKLNEDLKKVESKEERLKDLLATKEKEVLVKENEVGAAEREIMNCEKEIALLRRDIEEMEKRLREKREVYEGVTGFIKEREERIRALRVELSAVEKEIGEYEYKLMELRLKMENMIEQVRDKYSVNLEGLEYEVIRDEELNEFIKRLNEKKERINEIGEVNMESIREYDEIKQRFLYMTKQKEDLENAMKDLNSTIDRINSITREKFIDTFNKVNAKFKEVFMRLFSGGNAELILTDPQNILDSGVEAVVQPPGKRLQNMNLLSGGEKTLAAISLVFSLFLTRPSPFCILDEVDAPLDERNLEKFIAFIKELSRNIQFILVTHNRRTMEISDCLYGITMEKPGISRLVSVRLS